MSYGREGLKATGNGWHTGNDHVAQMANVYANSQPLSGKARGGLHD